MEEKTYYEYIIGYIPAKVQNAITEYKQEQEQKQNYTIKSK